MRNLAFFTLLLLAMSIPFKVWAQENITVENLQYDYNADTGVIKNFQFDIVYDDNWPRTGFSVYINFLDVNRSNGAISIDGVQGLGGTGEGSERRTIKFNRHFKSEINLNDVEDLYNGTFEITIYIPEYRETVYRFDDNEDNTLVYKTGEDFSTNISETKLSPKGDINLYPNPAKETDKIHLASGQAINLQSVFIYNIQGQMVKHKQNNFSSLEIASNNFAPGIYTVHIFHDKGKVVKQLLVNE